MAVVLPILSAAGIETSLLPTAVLSTHTGGFGQTVLHDLTSELLPIVKHWKTIGVSFDAMYMGYLGTLNQIDLMLEVYDLFYHQESFFLLDPVMGDHGRLYTSFTMDYPIYMRRLCQKADLIVPNLTEAKLLLEEEYRKEAYTKKEIERLLKKLATLGPKQIVLTGVSFDADTIGAAAYDTRTQVFSYSFAKKIPSSYPGTGDIFASVLLGSLLCGKTLNVSLHTAVEFTSAAIERSYLAGTQSRFGVNFEEGLLTLANKLNENF